MKIESGSTRKSTATVWFLVSLQIIVPAALGTSRDPHLQPCCFSHFCSCIPQPNPVAEIHCSSAPFTIIPTFPRGHYHKIILTGSSEIQMIPSNFFSNVTVSWFSLTESKLSKLDQNSFTGTESTLTTLNLSSNHLKIFPTSSLMSLPLIRWLSLRHNDIENLESGDIVPLSNRQFGLSTLLLSDNRLSIITDACFSSLRELKFLDLAGNMITRIVGRPFPSYLRSLTLSRNLLEHIPVNAFTNLRSLSWLRLGDNLIKSMPANWFLPMNSLKILDLSHNLLTDLIDDVFTPRHNIQRGPQRSFQPKQILNLTTILELNLDFNGLEDITSDCFLNVAIEKLSLSHNKLVDLDPGLLKGPLKNSLRSLDLSFNKLRQLPSPIGELKRLKSLTLKGNQISSIEEKALYGCRNHLQTLDLSGNSLKRIPNESLSLTSRLLYLSLQDNSINQVDDNDLLQWANSLLSLSLAGNSLRSISVNAFRHAGKLQQLLLSFNQIDDESTLALEPLRDTLVFLELASDIAPSRADLVMEHISRLPRLETLNLDLVSLKNLSIDHLTSSLPNLSHLDLESNRIDHLRSRILSASPPTVMNKETSGENGRDEIPWRVTSESVIEALKSKRGPRKGKKSKLRDLLLSDNELSTLPPGVFNSLDRLVSVVLTDNKLTSIEGNTFSDLPLLQNVFLNRNKISKISSNAFTGTNALVSINLQENRLESLPIDFVVMDGEQLIDATISGGSRREPQNGSERNISSEIDFHYSGENFFTDEEGREGQLLGMGGVSNSLSINVSYNQLTKLGWSQDEMQLINSSPTLSAASSPSGAVPPLFPPPRQLPVRVLDASHNNISQLATLDLYCDRLESLFLGYNQMTSIPISSLAKCHRLTTLSLSHNIILSVSFDHNTRKTGDIMENIVSLPSLLVLDASHNQIHNITTFIKLVSTLSNLRHLHLGYNKLNYLPDEFFSTMPPSLQSLSLAGNTLIVLPPSNIYRRSLNIEVLDLSYNQLDRIPPVSGEPNPLVILKLSGNRVRNITEDSLRPFHSLEQLYLDNNILFQFDGSALSPLIKLRILDISNCSLVSLIDLPMLELRELRMSSNLISNISLFEHSKARHLEHLNLSHNSLEEVPQYAWKFIPSLVQLDISYNPIEVLNATSFKSLRKLRHLDITGLSPKYVDSRCLQPLRNLISIKISTQPALRSFRLDNLLTKSLTLRHVSVTVREPLLYHQIQWAFGTELQELVITGSNLSNILPDAFLGLHGTALAVLRITGTNITNLPSGLLRYLSDRLTLIDLSRNHLQSLEREVLELRTKSQSEPVNGVSRRYFSGELIIGENPWICSCDQVWMSELLRHWAKKTRNLYLANPDINPHHDPTVFDFTCTTAHTDAPPDRSMEFRRNMRISCYPAHSSSTSLTDTSPLFTRLLIFILPERAYRAVPWIPSTTFSLLPLLSLLIPLPLPSFE